MADARCFRCKKQVPVTHLQDVITKNKMKAIRGTCAQCGGKVFKFTGKA